MFQLNYQENYERNVLLLRALNEFEILGGAELLYEQAWRLPSGEPIVHLVVKLVKKYKT